MGEKSVYRVPNGERYTSEEFDGIRSLVSLASLRLEGKELSESNSKFIADAVLFPLSYVGFSNYKDEIRYDWKNDKGSHTLSLEGDKDKVSAKLKLERFEGISNPKQDMFLFSSFWNSSKDLSGFDVEEVYIADERDYPPAYGKNLHRESGAVMRRGNDMIKLWLDGMYVQLKDCVKPISSKLNLDAVLDKKQDEVRDVRVIPKGTDKTVRTKLGNIEPPMLSYTFYELSRLANCTMENTKPVSLAIFINDYERGSDAMANYIENKLMVKADTLKRVLGKSDIKDGVLQYERFMTPVSFQRKEIDMELIKKGLTGLAKELGL